MKGFSLLEVVVALAILFVVLAALFVVADASALFGPTETLTMDLDGNARRVLDQLVTELRSARLGSIEPLDNGTASSLSASLPELATTVTYSFGYDTGELPNDRDDNNDLRVDEGLLLRTEGTQAPLVLCRDVPEGGLTFKREGGVILITLTLERLDGRLKAHTRTYQTRVAPRN